jgi:Ca2+ transporting ATPase
MERRIFAFQSNEKPKVECKGFFELFFDALGDFTLIILSIAAVISIVLSTATAKPEDRSHAWVEGFFILP